MMFSVLSKDHVARHHALLGVKLMTLWFTDNRSTADLSHEARLLIFQPSSWQHHQRDILGL